MSATSVQTALHEALCAGCGCLCDDLIITQITQAGVESNHLCGLGKAWFESQSRAFPSAQLNGQDVSWETALDLARSTVSKARFPVVLGLSSLSAEDQLATLKWAESIAAFVDPFAGTHLDDPSMAFSVAGNITATLGEIRQRADLIVCWNCDPVTSHPRWFERYAPSHASELLAVVSDQPSATSRMAKLVVERPTDQHIDLLINLRAELTGVATNPVSSEMGNESAPIKQLITRMQNARYGVVLYDPARIHASGGRLFVESLTALVRTLNRTTAFVSLGLSGSGNPLGAENVSTWHTGNTRAGFAKTDGWVSQPGTHIDALLSWNQPDTAVIVSGDPVQELSAQAKSHLKTIPTIHLGRPDEIMGQPAIHLPAATFAETGGTVFRMDHVPLWFRPIIKSSGRPSVSTILRMIGG